MKNEASNLGWIVALLLGVFVFLLLWQNQQNEHNEKMTDKLAGLDQQKHTQVIELSHVEERFSLKEKIQGGLKNTLSFLASIFSRLLGL